MTDTHFFQVNLNALSSISPEQAEKVASYWPKIQNRFYQVVPLKNDFLNISVHSQYTVGQPLFRTDRPETEIQAWLLESEIGREPFHAVILMGFELGYYALALLDRLPEKGVMAIVEPDPMVFFTAFSCADLSRLLGDSRIHLVIGQPHDKAVESVGRELQWGRFLSLPYHLLVTPLLKKVKPDFVKQFAECWRDALQREQMYRRARIEHSAQVVANTVANALAVVQYPGVAALFHHFQGVPAALVGAGPSLEKSADALRRFQDRMLIACVNTAYPVLRRNGIEPNLVVTMDHHSRNVHSFQEFAPAPESYLVADPRVDPGVIRRFHPRVFMASWKTTVETTGEPAPLESIPVPQKSGNAFYTWLQSECGEKGDLFGSGSVAVAAFHLLARMGCRPIVLTGQDFAFTDRRHYSPGTIFDDPNLPRDEEETHEVPSVEGGLVGTSDTLNLYRQLMEHEIARFKIPVFNTSSGAVIHGTITTRMSSLENELPAQAINVEELLSSLAQTHRPRLDAGDLQRILVEGIRCLQRFSEEARTALNQLPLELDELAGREEKQALLERLETSIQNCQAREPTAFLMLNELLQESHFKFEDAKWRALLENDEEAALNNRLRNHAAVLDEFVKQANVLLTLMEDKMHELDR